MNIPIRDWPQPLKFLISTFLIVLTIGVTIGLIYVERTTSSRPSTITEHYQGSELLDEFDIPEKYPKSINDLLLTTHTHVIAFAIIFVILGGLTFFSSVLKGGLKIFLMIEPLVSSCITFGSFWGIRFISPHFGIVAMISGILMYMSFYVIIAALFLEAIPRRS
ncbi:MAG: hypothetical protein U9N31_10870 [Candidatus Marinimicrobia bacterium]|nr:hypothetical protein [Candidatus Neomarinimicrobiota bacterium]